MVMLNPQASAFVLFGATGDLAQRMIWPSLYNLHADGLLSPDLRIVGTARGAIGVTGLQDAVRRSLDGFLPAGRLDGEMLKSFLARLDYVEVDAARPEQFAGLAQHLGEAALGALYYLAVSPAFYGAICAGLSAAGLVEGALGVVLEKPIGKDLKSSNDINSAVGAAFDERRVFRVDHYLGKETVQNLLALRFGNVLFEPLWDARSIEHVQITIAETVGVEGRWSYYDSSGALRDMVQNHMLQLLALVAMEPPSAFDPQAVRNEKIKVLRSLRPMTAQAVATNTVAAQYGPGLAGGTPVRGYLEEGSNPHSRTETFVALRAEIGNWRWAGVPFFLRTGKRLRERRTEIVVQFRDVPHDIFPGGRRGKNRLRICLQPDETVELSVNAKIPGLDGMKLQPVKLNLSLTDTFQAYRRRIAYERLILDALKGATTLFVRRDEVEAAWEWIDLVSKGWLDADVPPETYASGSMGPQAAGDLIAKAGFSWADQ